MDRQPLRISVVKQLRAIQKALADPRRLVDAVSGTDNHDQAIDALRREFQFTVAEATVVLDQQFLSLTRSGLNAIREHIARAEAEGVDRSFRGPEDEAT